MLTTDLSTQGRFKFKMSLDLRRAMGVSAGHWELPASIGSPQELTDANNRSEHTILF